MSEETKNPGTELNEEELEKASGGVLIPGGISKPSLIPQLPGIQPGLQIPGAGKGGIMGVRG